MSKLSRGDKIFVAGHKGLVGSAICRKLDSLGYESVITRDRAELDLLDFYSVENFFKKEKPHVVFLAAAKVGGIHANNTYRADFLYENLQIQNNVIWNAHNYGTHRLIFLGSSCIYPRDCPQPIKEEYLLTGKLEYTNQPYAIAKIAGIELINGLRKQYGRDYFCVMPTNLFGINDNFHPENSHVLPALIRKFCEAKEKKLKEVVVWGDGTPLREFMFSDDLADAVCYLAQNLSFEEMKKSETFCNNFCHINVGSQFELSIAELSQIIAKLVSYSGLIKFDTSKPNGTPRKIMDSSYLKNCGWNKVTPFENNLKFCIDWFLKEQRKFEKVLA